MLFFYFFFHVKHSLYFLFISACASMDKKEVINQPVQQFVSGYYGHLVAIYDYQIFSDGLAKVPGACYLPELVLSICIILSRVSHRAVPHLNNNCNSICRH